MISVEDVQRLLESDSPDATLTIVGGRAVVVSGEEEDTGMSVISRADLLERVGDRRDDRRGLEEIAAELDTAVSELGG